jgi:hypothetical protein
LKPSRNEITLLHQCDLSLGTTNAIDATVHQCVSNRRTSFYKANVVVLVAVRSPKEYFCVILPVAEAERAAQLNLDRDYRTLTRGGQRKKPHKVWILLEPRLRARPSDVRFAEERDFLAPYRDEHGWARLLQSN